MGVKSPTERQQAYGLPLLVESKAFKAFCIGEGCEAMKRIIRSAVTGALCTALLCGCSDISFGEQTLLRPPRATGAKAEIQTIIKEQAGNNYTLKYPQNGDHRSAVTVFETGKDKNHAEYAAALYSTDNDSKLNLSVMKNDGEQWSWLGSFTNAGTGVDRLVLYDINNDGNDEILVGWTTYNTGQNTLSAYSLEEDSVREMSLNEIYTDIVIGDITEDKTPDIMLVSLRNDKSSSNIKLLQYSEQEKKPIGKFFLELDSEVVKFVSIICGKIDKNKSGIIIDGEKPGDILTTQVIYFDDESGELIDPLVVQNETQTVTNVTTRKDVITSRDIDSDGIIEIPVVSQLPAQPDTAPGAVCSMTSWEQMSVDKNVLKPKYNTVMNYNDGYYFMIPDVWNGSVTAISNAGDRCIDFYKWDSKTSVIGEKLISVTRFTSSEWEKADKNAYVVHKNVSNNQNEYIIAVQRYYKDNGDEMNINSDKLEKAVVLIL